MRACVPRLSASDATSATLYTSGNWSGLRGSVTASTPGQVKELLAPSLVPTRHYQRSLPKLPLPALQDTIQRYLAAAAPLCTPNQLHATTAMTESFARDEGRRLHEELRRTDKANPHTSYISSDLYELTLKQRSPLPLQSHRTWLVRPDPEKQDVLVRSAHWIWASVHFYKLYLENQLAPEVRDATRGTSSFGGGGGASAAAAAAAGRGGSAASSAASTASAAPASSGYWTEDWFERTMALLPEYVSAPCLYHASRGHAQPLDMAQFDCLFNCTRMPGVLQDELKPVGYEPRVAVQYRGHQFMITVADADCVPLSIDELHAQLRDIVQTRVTPPHVDVSVLTSLPRSEWNSARTTLLRNAGNARNLEAVEESMFVLNLDADDEADAMTEPLCAVGVTAKSPSIRATNRWWDKTLSVSVNKRGDVAVSAESSWGDGGAVRRYMNDVYALSTAAHADLLKKEAPAAHPVRQLHWQVPTELNAVALRATKRVQQERQRLDVAAGVLDVPDVSTSAVEATTQLAAQLALFRVLQLRPGNCAQPLSMHHYRRGRTEPLPLTTAESTAFLLSTCAGSGAAAGASAATRQAACAAALRRYAADKRAVENGSSTHGHLLALRVTAERMLGRAPELYRDPVYALVAQPVLRFEVHESPAAYAAGYAVNPFGYQLSCSRSGGSLLFQVSALSGSGSSAVAASCATLADAFAEACREVAQVQASSAT